MRPRWHFAGKAARKAVRGAALVVANHQSYLDPIHVLLAVWYRRLHMVATSQLFSTRLGAWFFHRMLCIPIDKQNFHMQTFREVIARLKKGCTVTIFPEGMLNTEKDTIRTFRAGVILMAMKGDAPVVPVYIVPRKHWYEMLHIVVGAPVLLTPFRTENATLADVERAAEFLHEREQTLKQFYENRVAKKRARRAKRAKKSERAQAPAGTDGGH